jgi:putative transposase
MVYLWRAVDAEREVLDLLVQSKRNQHAALKLMRKLLKKYAFVPKRLVTDDLRSYGATARALGIEQSARSAQKFLSTYAAVYNIFNVQRHLISAQSHRMLRAAAMTT